jgi:hypothetical protein
MNASRQGVRTWRNLQAVSKRMSATTTIRMDITLQFDPYLRPLQDISPPRRADLQTCIVVPRERIVHIQYRARDGGVTTERMILGVSASSPGVSNSV